MILFLEKQEVSHLVCESKEKRKIIKFEDKENYPCNYFKIVPFYVFFLLAILSLILLFVDMFAEGLITNVISGRVFKIIIIFFFGISILYFLVIVIWWEIVDYNELKFTKEEKKKLKQLKKIRKENKKNK